MTEPPLTDAQVLDQVRMFRDLAARLRARHAHRDIWQFHDNFARFYERLRKTHEASKNGTSADLAARQ